MGSDAGRGRGRFPHAQADRHAALEQLDRILSSPLFRHSKRCAPLLRYVVTEALEGRASRLKERTIGVEVFGRKAEYDTNEDTIVRAAASEVRKRLAQYYHEPERGNELRIELIPGSYVPEFGLPASQPAAAPAGHAEVASVAKAGREPPARRRSRKAAVAALVGVVAVGIGIATAKQFASRDPVIKFWSPLWDGADTIVFGIGGSADRTLSDQQDPNKGLSILDAIRADQVGFADLAAAASVAGMLQSRGIHFEMRRSSSLALRDLSQFPTVWIGAFNNPWTLRLQSDLRYSIEWVTTAGNTAIRDRQNPSQMINPSDPRAPYSGKTEDYAVISRFRHPKAGRFVLLIAGHGKDGTAVAGEFVSQSRYLREFDRQAPRGWERRNLQIVIATDVHHGSFSPPRIVATHVW